jgi:hypothetical protein
MRSVSRGRKLHAPTEGTKAHMRLRLMHRGRREGRLSRAVVIAYAEWRSECAAVRTAYLQWKRASAAEKSVAFEAYNTALTREEDAAKRYARRMRRAGSIRESALAHHLARVEAGSRSW